MSAATVAALQSTGALPLRAERGRVMTKKKGKHLSREDREVIESGIRNGDSSRAIAKRIGVSPSTVTREVKAHRTVVEKKLSAKENASLRCANRESCQASGTACPKCSTKLTNCKDCRTRRCILTCPDYEPKMCPATGKWPYVCPDRCPKRGWCGLPKCGYDAGDADAAYRTTLSSSRSGTCCTQEELDAMNAIVVPLAKQGQSFEAIWAEHGDELPVCVRSGYKYQELNAVGLTSLDMPRKARLLPRRRAGAGGALKGAKTTTTTTTTKTEKTTGTASGRSQSRGAANNREGAGETTATATKEMVSTTKVGRRGGAGGATSTTTESTTKTTTTRTTRRGK